MDQLSQRALQNTIDLVPGYLCHADFEGRFTWVTANWAALLGVPVEQLVGRRFAEFMHEDDVEPSMAVMADLAQGGTVDGFKNRYRRANGEILWLSWHARSDGTLIYARATDVTTEVLRGQELTRANRILRLAGDIAEVGYWSITLQSGELFWSPQTFRIHGLDPNTPCPSTERAISYYHPDDRARVLGLVNAAVEEGIPFAFEHRLIRSDGEERLVRSKGVVEHDARGQPSALLGIFQDITDERRMERELRDAERLASLETMAASVAHEINNPLQYLSANLLELREVMDELQASIPDALAEDMGELLSDCIHGAGQVGRFVRDLRTMVQGNRNTDRIEDLDLHQLVRSAINITRCRTRLGARLTVSLSDVPPVQGVQGELMQVMLNLLTNALHAIEGSAYAGSGSMRVRVFQDRLGSVIVEVEDNGPGVPEEIQARVFEPFFTTKPLGIGHGLGLHICRGIVQEHKGDILLDSRPGRTVFRVRLPGNGQRVETAPVRAVPRVLVVDDDPRVAQSVTRILRDVADCEQHTDPLSALERAMSSSFDLVVTDVMMPSMTGWELANRLIDGDPAYAEKIILISGAAPATYRPENSPHLPFIAKPFAPADLRGQVATLWKAQVDAEAPV